MVSHLLTYTSGHTETVVDYILVNCCCRNRVKNVKKITGEEVVSKHHILVMDSVEERGEAQEKV